MTTDKTPKDEKDPKPTDVQPLDGEPLPQDPPPGGGTEPGEGVGPGRTP